MICDLFCTPRASRLLVYLSFAGTTVFVVLKQFSLVPDVGNLLLFFVVRNQLVIYLTQHREECKKQDFLFLHVHTLSGGGEKR